MLSRKKGSNDYLIDINDYEVIRNINKGGFGTINLVKNKTNGDQYATKTNLIQNQAQNKLFISREIRILIQIQHPTIIRFRGFSYIDFKGDKNITIFMDYMPKGSLASLIEEEMKSLCPTDYDNTKRQIILVGIARGMMLLHKHCIIHRDLKPENILLDSEFRPCITDFGLSKFFDPSNSMSQSMTDTGTACYMAPEVISSDHFNTKADVYAFGILMYEVIGGKRAYNEYLHGRKKLNQFQLKLKVKEGLRPTFDFPIKKGLKKMIEKCWSENPKERPSFEEIFKKLSLSSEDYLLEFDRNYEEPKIFDSEEDENDDDDDEIDEEIESGLVLTKKYCLDNVDTFELLDYVDEIKVEEKTKSKSNEKEIQEMKEEMEKIKKEVVDKSSQISALQTQLDKVKKEKDSEILSLQVEMKRLRREKEEEISTLQKSIGNIFSAEPSANELGILGWLSLKRKSRFDRPFIASQSSNDIYTLLIPESNDCFLTSDISSFIEFELERAVTINGVKIFSADYFFPRSFDITVDDTQTVASIKDARQLNGQNKSLTLNFPSVRTSKIRFIQTGPSWENTEYLNIKGIELLSTEPKYSKGVFATLVDECENHDPHKCPVIINATNYSNNKFHLMGDLTLIETFDIDNSWFQIELTQGAAILYGFRIRKVSPGLLKSYKIICTDDVTKDESQWTTMFEINEKIKEEYKLISFFKFEHPSPLVRFIRIVMTGPKWDDKLRLKLYHFDIFGCYI